MNQAISAMHATAYPDRIHIGCGSHILSGWMNVDLRQFDGVDAVVDVRQGLPFDNVAFVYAEHFIEHLQLDDGFRFLRDCRRILAPRGRLRLSTPNLDWVMQSHYAYGRWSSHDDAIRDALATNMAFHGWGHKFLYNVSMLSLVLEAAGFTSILPCAYGESEVDDLRGLEGHDKSPDWPGLPHVVIVEAHGIGEGRDLPERFRDYVRTCDAY